MSLEEDDVWRCYAVDAGEALRAIEVSLLALEGDPHRPAEINQLYRALHTLKGNSGFLELSSIERLAHVAEDMVGLVRDGAVSFDPTMTDLMLAVVDRLRVVVDRAAAERRDAELPAVADIIARVLDMMGERTGVRPAETAGPRQEQTDWSFHASTPPPPPAARPSRAPPLPPEDNPASLEMFLALAREAVAEVDADAALGPGGGTNPAMRRASDDLRHAAEALGFGAVTAALEGIGAAGARGDAPVASDLRAALADVEVRYRALADAPGDFGFAAAAAAEAPETAPPIEARAAIEAHDDPALPAVAETALRRPPAVVDASSSTSGGTAAADSLRIDGNKLSLVMDLAGELGLACDAVTHHAEIVGLDLEGFSAAAHKLEKLVRELQNEVSGLRLVPVEGVFKRMSRVVRDTARRTGKQVELELVGEETEIDKVMVDALQDPLVHMIRNAIDHGIEPPEERVRLGKPPIGRIVLEASYQGGEVSVEISDDGRGLDRPRILEQARARGLIAPDARLTDDEMDELVFQPGFSTKKEIDALSGRGVGMDVIKTTIAGLRGRVKLRSVTGRGVRLSMTVPLTLAFIDAMIVSHNDHMFALPIERVLEVFQAGSAQIARSTAQGVSLVRVRDRLIPVLWLHEFFGEACATDTRIEGRVVIVVQTSVGGLALPVDALLGSQQILLKPLRGLLCGVRAASGYGLLRSGDVCLALDCERLRAA
jgi:two-component system chemotaxis sensor kinase CheA